MPEMEPTEPLSGERSTGLSEGMQSLADMPSFEEHMAEKEVVAESKNDVAENKEIEDGDEEIASTYGDTVAEVLERAASYRAEAAQVLGNAKKLIESKGYLGEDAYVPVFHEEDDGRKLLFDEEFGERRTAVTNEKLDYEPVWDKGGYPDGYRLRKANEYEKDYILIAGLLTEYGKMYIESAEEGEADVAEHRAEKGKEAEDTLSEIDELLARNEERHYQPAQGVENKTEV